MSGAFVFLSTISWDDAGGAHRPVQIARELRRRGHRVLFVEIQRSRIRPADPQLTVVSLSELGLTERAARYAWFGREPQGLSLVGEQLAGRLDTWLDPALGRRTVIWCAPYLPFVRFWELFRARGFTTMYDGLDDFDGLNQLGYFFSSPEAETFLVRHCDLTLAVTPALVEKLRQRAPGAPVHLLRNGFDAELATFTATRHLPVTLERGECTLGFWGIIGNWTIDADALEYVARARPHWVLNLIGAVDPDPSRMPVAPRLRALPNVRLLGAVPHAQLPRYLAGFDVCLIPFARNAFNAGREPIKLYEYLAGHKPVVALNAPQLEAMPAVYLAATPEEFLQQIECARTTPVDWRAVDAYLAGCTWRARTDSFLNLLANTRSRPAGPYELPAFYPEPSLSPNWSDYLGQVDRLLDERSAYIEQMEREWGWTQAYLQKLERTHPLVWLKRLLRKG